MEERGRRGRSLPSMTQRSPPEVNQRSGEVRRRGVNPEGDSKHKRARGVLLLKRPPSVEAPWVLGPAGRGVAGEASHGPHVALIERGEGARPS